MTNHVTSLHDQESTVQLDRSINALLSSDLAPIFHQPALLDKPSAWFGHTPFAYWVVKATRPRTLVELGTHAGVSYATFCAAVKAEKTGTRCWAVDTWKGDVQAGLYPEVIFEDLSTFNDTHFKEFSTLLRSTFDDALTHFDDGSIDLLHIDGFHSYEAVSHDFNTWKPKLSDRAVVLFHDTNEFKEGFGVYKFWEEVTREHPSFSFLHAHGLGVLAVGPKAPEAIRSLCAIKDEETLSALRSRFEVIGTSWQAQARLLRQQQENATLRAEHKKTVQQLQKEVSELVDKHLALAQEKRVIEREQEQAQKEATEAKIAALESRVKELDATVKRLNRERREILESTSWLLTRPVRELARLSPSTLKTLVRLSVHKPYRAAVSLRHSQVVKKAFKLPPLNWLKNRIRDTQAVESQQFDTARSKAWLRTLLAHPARREVIQRNPLVSIILPTRNRAHLISNAISSIIAQSYPNWELLVIDDGSTDGTADIVRTRFVDGRISILQSHGQGVCEARNCGLRAARGDFIAYLDSDNAWTPKYLEYMLYDLERNGAECGYAVLHCVNTKPSFYRQVEFDYTRLKTGNFIDLNVFFHRKNLFDKLGGFDPSLKRMVDWELILRYTQNAKVTFAYFIGALYDAGPALDRITNSENVSYKDVIRNRFWIDWKALEQTVSNRDESLASIVIVASGPTEHLDACLTALFTHPAGEAFEVILVDNRADYQAKAVIDRWAKTDNRITAVRNPEHFNRALANNMGFAASRGSLIVFLDPRSEVATKGWLAQLLQPLSNPAVCATHPRCSAGPNEPQKAVWDCLALRATDFCSVAGFDPIYANSHDGLDLLLRIGKGSLSRSHACDEVIRINDGPQSINEDEMKKNETIFYERWPNALV